MDLKLVKVGNDYINAVEIERFLVIDNEVYLSTSSGHERTLTKDLREDSEQAMKKIVRRTGENAHDIIFLDAFAVNSEEMLALDQASNMLYRQWLERQEAQQSLKRKIKIHR